MQSLVTFFRKARQPGRQGSGPASARLTDWCHRISAFIGAGGIRRRLALSTAFVLLPCILAAHVALVATVNVDQQEARAQVQAEAIDLNLLIARDFENMRNLGQYLARIEPLLRHDPHQMHSVFAATIGTDANLHIALVDAAGQQLFNTRAATGAILPRLADQTGVERAISIVECGSSPHGYLVVPPFVATYSYSASLMTRIPTVSASATYSRYQRPNKGWSGSAGAVGFR